MVKKWCNIANIPPNESVEVADGDEFVPYFAEDPTYSGFTFLIDAETGEYVLAGASNSITSAEIPALKEGQIVSVISNSAFSYYFSLQTVTMPQTITKIGDSAFSGCSSLTSISIPDSVTSIGSSAFSHCFSITSIDVDSNNAYYCSIDGVLFNKDLTRLVQYPLAKTNTSYIIVASVKNIDGFAFCSGYARGESSVSYLTSITFEITNNWYTSDEVAIDVSNPTTNATNLTAVWII